MQPNRKMRRDQTTRTINYKVTQVFAKMARAAQMSLTLDHRPLEISDGIATHQMALDGKITFLPAGSLEVSMDEESVEGRIVYDASVRLGNEVIENLVINVKNGRIFQFNATRGAKVLERYLEEVGGMPGDPPS